jgi:hypothetical protein
MTKFYEGSGRRFQRAGNKITLYVKITMYLARKP